MQRISVFSGHEEQLVPWTLIKVTPMLLNAASTAVLVEEIALLLLSQ